MHETAKSNGARGHLPAGVDIVTALLGGERVIAVLRMGPSSDQGLRVFHTLIFN